jgi:hypothetical protein
MPAPFFLYRDFLHPTSYHTSHVSSSNPQTCQLSTTPQSVRTLSPSASLTRTFVAYSSTTYDRSPIIVTPNSCALPECCCLGRTHGVNDSPTPPNRHLPGPSACLPQYGRDYHPRTLALGSMAHHDDHVSHALNSDYMQRTQNFPPPPQLVPDTSSSESDESDGSAHTLADLRLSTSYPASSCLHNGLSIPNANSNTSIRYNSPAQSSLTHFLIHPNTNTHRVRKLQRDLFDHALGDASVPGTETAYEEAIMTSTNL